MIDLRIVRVNGAARWAIRAIYKGETRYRGFHYRNDAVREINEWAEYSDLHFEREFKHNFTLASELRIQERPF